jgi:TonB family protein
MKLFLVAILLLSSGLTFAQKKQNVYFLKNDDRYVDNRDSADYIRVVQEPDSGTVYFNVLEFYKSGKRKFAGKSSKIEILFLQGPGIDFFENGNKKTIATYKDDQFIGVVYNYFPSGKLFDAIDYRPDTHPQDGNEVTGDGYESIEIKECRDSAGKVLVENGNGYFIGNDSRLSHIKEEGAIVNGKRYGIWRGKDSSVKITFSENYKEGKFLSGESIDSAGIKHSYTRRVIKPQYAGGSKALYAYLANHIYYPEYARAHDIQGTVVLSFVIKKDGKIKDIKVIKPVDPLLDNEAIRVLKNAKGWQPGVYYGIPADVVYTIPVNFTLTN